MPHAPDLLAAAEYRSLSVLGYGPSKSGKSWLGYTTPAPRLLLDTEGGRSSRFIPKGVRKITWDPHRFAPPEAGGTWDTCVVHVRTVADLEQVLLHLGGGQHPFRSVVLDSLWDLQQTYVDAIAGVEQLKVQDWGQLLRRLLDVINRLRDLLVAPVNPVSVLYLTTAERLIDGRTSPYMQGQIANLLLYKLDLIVFCLKVPDLETGVMPRAPQLLTQPWNGIAAGEAVGGVLPALCPPNVEEILNMIYGAAPAASEATAQAATAAPAAEEK